MEVARRTGATILSVDSMQVYLGMDLGTAKASRREREEVPHLMVDVAPPEYDYTVAEFQQEARARLADAEGPVLVVGGSGLHFRAVVDPLEFPPSDAEVRRVVESLPDEEIVDELRRADPAVDGAVDLRNRRRTVRAVEILRLTGLTPTDRRSSSAARDVRRYRAMIPVSVFGLERRRDIEERIRLRVETMRYHGLLTEVESLRHRMGTQARQAVGYKELLPVVDGRLAPDAGFEQVVRSTLALVKHQRTYFGRDPRIRWFDGAPQELVSVLTSTIAEGSTG